MFPQVSHKVMSYNSLEGAEAANIVTPALVKSLVLPQAAPTVCTIFAGIASEALATRMLHSPVVLEGPAVARGKITGWLLAFKNITFKLKYTLYQHHF